LVEPWVFQKKIRFKKKIEESTFKKPAGSGKSVTGDFSSSFNT